MQINLMLNGVRISEDVAPDMLLIDFVRRHGCLSVKRGCETSNCGLCTVFLDDKPVLSCSGAGRPRRRSQGDHAGGPAEEAADSVPSSPIRAQSSAVSATRASS